MLSAGLIGQVRKVLDFIDQKYRRWVVLLMALSVISSILEVLSITAILPLFQVLLDPAHATRNHWLQRYFGEVQPSYFFLIVCAGIFSLFAMKSAVLLSASWLQYWIQARMYENLSCRLLNFYLESPLSFHLRHNSPELLRNVTSYVSQATQYGFLGLVNLTSDVLLGIGIVILLVWLEPRISLVAAAGLGLIASIYIMLGQPYFLRLSRRYKTASAKVLRVANESLVGVKTLKTLGREDYFEDLYRHYVAEFCRVLQMNSFVAVVPRQALELIAVGALLGLLSWPVLNGRDPVGVISIMAVFSVAIYRLMPAVVRIATTLQNMRFGYDAIEVVHAGIMYVRATKRTRPSVHIASLPVEISLRGVTFSYEGANRPALDSINLDIRNGEAVALVGSSGAGKTTLADLILGLHKPDSGAVVINNVDYSDPSAIPSGTFGYVPQDSFLIDDTIRRNIALGIPDDEIDDAQLARAVTASALDEFIAGLPNGVDTLVGDRGVRLSGGQRQRIGIARAMYVNPNVLVLDEATSSIDSTTEADISAAINRLHGRKTLIIIAHRLSTIRECDRVVFLDQGRLAASGRYDEVIKKNASFAAMANQLATNTGFQPRNAKIVIDVNEQ
jgi:ABC-type multidrug transport system fused ATPase/permease subunit